MSSIETHKKLADMLCEQTVRCLVDSSILGRHDQHNRAAVELSEKEPHELFYDAPEATLRFYERGEVDLTISLFHFLERNLEYDADVARFFDAFDYLCWLNADGIYDDAKDFTKALRCARVVGLDCVRWIHQNAEEAVRGAGEDMWNRGCPWYYEYTIKVFYDYLRHLGYKVAGIYGEDGPLAWYTYNEETALNQDFQCWYFSVDCMDADRPYHDHICNRCKREWTDEEPACYECPGCGSAWVTDLEVPPPIELDGSFCIIRIHNGADARWGFTDPVIFREEGDTELGILDSRRGYIGCSNPDCDAFWYSYDGGYSWDHDGSPPEIRDLKDYDFIELELTEPCEKLAWPCERLFIDNERNGYCPHCGHRLYGAIY